MSKINLLLTLLSLTAVLVIIERLSPTTKIILQPYSFLRVHEVFQMLVVIMLSIVISFYILKYLSRNFELLKTSYGTFIAVIFILGIYFTATGNGLHEVASFFFNTFCDTKHIQTDPCGSMFFDDYYFGNIVYFVGLFLGNISLMLLERQNPLKSTNTKQTTITTINAIFSALAFTAYAAFDPVLVGVYYVIISAVTALGFWVVLKKHYTLFPYTLYTAVGYALASIFTLLIRFH